MRTIIICSMAALGFSVITPAMAQGVYVGPGGVGVDTGVHSRRDYDRDRDDSGFHNRRFYEGRSAYDGRNYHRDRD